MADLATIKEGPELMDDTAPAENSPVAEKESKLVEGEKREEKEEKEEKKEEAKKELPFEYTKPIEDPLEKASRYMSKHGILPLFQELSENIAYNRPEDPIDHLISEIKKIRDLDRLRKGVIKKSELDDKH